MNNNYNDGYIRVFKEKIINTDFNAKKNINSIENLDLIVKLAYQECSKRQKDMEFAESNNRNLNIKVKTPFFLNIENNYKVTIENTLYDIIYVDSDKKNRVLYIYLEEVKKIV